MGGITGTYYHNIDAKGRLNLPAKLREELGETFWISGSLTGKFISLYPQDAWKEYAAQFETLKGVEGEKIRRCLYSRSAEVTQDKQGRVLIPPPMRSFAELDKDVVILGVGKKAELWDIGNWTNEEESFDPSTSAVLETLCL